MPFPDAPRWVIGGLIAGLAIVVALAFWSVSNLQKAAMAEALRENGRRFEGVLQGVVDRVAREELTESDDLARFGDRLLDIAAGLPLVLDIVVVTPERQVVRRAVDPERKLPCFRRANLLAAMDHEHPAGAFGSYPVGCRVYPVRVAGEHRGAVVIHTKRDWLASGDTVRRLVRGTTLRLAPVFLVFYLVLGGLLLAATRATRRWRQRALAAERVEALGALAAGINHEVRNPLNAVALSLQYLERKHPDADTGEVVATARRQTERIAATLEEFVRFTRISRLELGEGDVAERLRRRVAESAAPVDVEGEARACVDEERIDEALAAVVEIWESRAAPGARVRARFREKGANWTFSASGETEGLDAAAVERLFAPFVRGRPDDVGRGLALPRAIFQAHGGELSARLKGTTLTVRGEAPRAPAGPCASPRERKR